MIGLQGHTYMHYWYALVLLGIGWNFLYVGSTTMVTLTYGIGERFRAQAVNEFCVFGTSAAASLLAGTMTVRGVMSHVTLEKRCSGLRGFFPQNMAKERKSRGH